MTVIATDLIDPSGSIDLAMFPGKTEAEVQAILDAYIARAEAIVDARAIDSSDQPRYDIAVTTYVYYLAADTVYRRLSLNAASLTFADDGSRTRNQGQIDMWGARAAAYLAEFEVIAPEPLPEGTTDNRTSTVCEPTNFSW